MSPPSAAHFEGCRVVHTHEQTIDAPPDQVFPLICPIREAEWLDGWNGAPIHAPSGVAEAHGVYASFAEGQRDPTIWVITKRDPVTYETEFVGFVPGHQVFQLSVSIRPRGAAQSAVAIRYVRTGLSEAGNAALAQAQRSGTFMERTKEWERAMNRYFGTARGSRRSSAGEPP